MDLLSAARLTHDRNADAINQFKTIYENIETELAATHAEDFEAELHLIETALDQQQDLVLKASKWFGESLNPLLALRANNK